MNPEQLTDIRRELIRRRAELSADERTAAADAIARAIESHPLFARSRDIALYFAVRGEADPTGIAAAARQSGKRLYLPVLRERELVFRHWREGSEMQPNSFGISEPTEGARIEPARLDLVLAPLVAFDAAGHRVGMGGGFYDRTFAFLGDGKTHGRPRLVGVAYELQRFDALPAQPWDIPLHAIVTEAGWEDFHDIHKGNGS